MVIPIMDHLDQHLATSVLDLSLPASICVAATLGKHTLNKYYTMTDLSEIYRIAMSKVSILFFNYLVLIDLFASSTSPSQAQLFQKSQVGQQVDQHG